MKEEKELLREIGNARRSARDTDRFIEKYTPFVKSEVMRFSTGGEYREKDDEISVALFAFYEALMNYDSRKGAFFPMARVYIRNRLIDHFREERESAHISLDQEIGEDGRDTLLDMIEDEKSSVEYRAERECTAEEIRDFRKALDAYGLTFEDIAENAPRQQRTQDTCIAALSYARKHPDLLTSLTETKKLPMARLVREGGFDRKTLERHRKYLVGMFLAFTNGFVIIRGHLARLKEGNGD